MVREPMSVRAAVVRIAAAALVTALAAGLLVGFGAGVASGASARQPWVPRGFAYAARVQLSVTYHANLTAQNQADAVCDSPSSGAQTTTQTSESVARTAAVTATYPTLTVPIVPVTRLGASARALALTHTGISTATGRVTDLSDTYDLSGTALVGMSCDTYPWSCQGSYAATSEPPGLRLSAAAYGFDPVELAFRLGGSTGPNPADCEAGGEPIDVASTIAAAISADAQPGSPGFRSVALTRLDALAGLAHASSVTISTGPFGCGSEEIGLCDGGLSSSARVVVTRIALLRTSRSYGTRPARRISPPSR